MRFASEGRRFPDMWVFVWLGLPFIIGALIGAAIARSWRGAAAAAVLGLAIAFGLVLWVYFSSPTVYDGCECNLVLGRWWEPQFVLAIVGIGYVCWLIGVGVGAGVRRVVRGVPEPGESGT